MRQCKPSAEERPNLTDDPMHRHEGRRDGGESADRLHIHHMHLYGWDPAGRPCTDGAVRRSAVQRQPGCLTRADPGQ